MILQGTILMEPAELGIERAALLQQDRVRGICGKLTVQLPFLLFQPDDLRAQEGQVMPKLGAAAPQADQLMPEGGQGSTVCPAVAEQFSPERLLRDAEGSVAVGHGANTSP